MNGKCTLSSSLAWMVIFMLCPVVDAQESTPLRVFTHAQRVPAVAFAPDDQRLLTGSYDKEARLWDLATGNMIHAFSGHTGLVYDVAFFPDGDKILTASSDYKAKIWDTETGTVVFTLTGHNEEVLCCAVSPDGSLVATGGGRADKSVIIWNPDTGTQVTRLYGHGTQSNNYIVDLVFSPNGEYLASSGFSDGKILVRRTSDWQIVNTLSGYCADFTPDSSRILTLDTSSHTLNLYECESGSLVKTYNHPADITEPIKISPEGTQILCGSGIADSKLTLINADTGDILERYTTAPFNQMRFSSDKKLLVAGALDGTVKVWSNEKYWVPVELSQFHVD